jgi:O-antigen/teichoic acid export membrane protein
MLKSLGWELLLSALVFPTSILVNRYLGAEDRGLFSLVLLFPSTIVTLGTCQWDRLVKGLISSQQISSLEAWRRTIYYTRILSLIVIPLTVVSSLLYTKLSFDNRILSALYSLAFPFLMLSGSLMSIYVSNGSIDKRYIMKTAYQVTYIAAIAILIISGNISVATLIFANIIVWIVPLFFGLNKITTTLTGQTLAEKPSIKSLTSGFLPYALEVTSLNAEIWAFSLFTSLSDVGYFVAITGLAQPINIIANALDSSSTAKLNWNNDLIVRGYLIKTTVVMLGFMLVGMLTGEILLKFHLFELLLGKSFAGAGWMIPWVISNVVLKSISVQFHFAVQLSGRSNSYLLVQYLDSLIRLTIVIILGWVFSGTGILTGSILCSLIKCFASIYFLSKRKLRTVV